MIRKDLSPKQVSDRFKKERGILISHERIYQCILSDKRVGRDLYRHLRCQKKCKKHYALVSLTERKSRMTLLK